VRGQWQSRYRWLVTGTAGGAESGTSLVLAQAAACIQALQEPVDAVLLLISTCGQRLRYQEEMLSLHQAMLHLSACLFALRQAGKPVLGLVCNQAAASAVVTGGMQCDALWALPEAQIRVMSADAIVRVTGSDMTADSLRLAQTAQAHWQTGAVHQLCEAPTVQCWMTGLQSYSDNSGKIHVYRYQISAVCLAGSGKAVQPHIR
jgi:malonate decarboxylase gamma subunit